jgi:hypothetical protein
MAMQADTMDNKSRMKVKMTVFQGRQSDVPCNNYVCACRFPMPKDHLLYLALQQEGLAVPPQQQQQQQQQLQGSSQLPAPPPPPPPPAAAAARLRSNVFTPTYPDAGTLCLVHDPAYVEAFLTGVLTLSLVIAGYKGLACGLER